MSYPNVLEKFKEYLPLSGGTMTGHIQKNGFLAMNTVDNNILVIRGGTDATSAFMGLCGKNHSNKGMAYLCATDGENTTNFCVHPSGVATLGGKNIITSDGGNMSGSIIHQATTIIQRKDDTGALWIHGGVAWGDGASLELCGKSRTINTGGFMIQTNNGTIRKNLTGGPTTDLSWDGKKVVCVTHYRSGTLWYRLFNDGFIEQGGTDTRTTASDVTISFPKAFTSTNIQVMTGSHTGYSVVRSKTKTTFVLGRNTANTTYWFACGY